VSLTKSGVDDVVVTVAFIAEFVVSYNSDVQPTALSFVQIVA